MENADFSWVAGPKTPNGSQHKAGQRHEPQLDPRHLRRQQRPARGLAQGEYAIK
jgi:hypothetical protein